MLFGEYLLEQELVKEEDLIFALDAQQKNKMPLGQMAVQKGLIDSKALFKVLTEQRKKTREPNDFGSIALEMHFLNEEQVNELVGSQNTTNELLGTILVDGGYLPRQQLVQALKEYNTKHRK